MGYALVLGCMFPGLSRVTQWSLHMGMFLGCKSLTSKPLKSGHGESSDGVHSEQIGILAEMGMKPGCDTPNLQKGLTFRVHLLMSH